MFVRNSVFMLQVLTKVHKNLSVGDKNKCFRVVVICSQKRQNNQNHKISLNCSRRLLIFPKCLILDYTIHARENYSRGEKFFEGGGGWGGGLLCGTFRGGLLVARGGGETPPPKPPFSGHMYCIQLNQVVYISLSYTWNTRRSSQLLVEAYTTSITIPATRRKQLKKNIWLKINYLDTQIKNAKKQYTQYQPWFWYINNPKRIM